MDNELVLSTLRSFEDRRAVTAAALANELDVDPGTVQTALDSLVNIGEVCVSELRTRRNEGYPFTTRSVWYHTPEREVAARFGGILSMAGARPPQRSSPAKVPLAS